MVSLRRDPWSEAARPSPVPWLIGLVVKKGSNALRMVLALMPEPVSITLMQMYSPSFRPGRRDPSTVVLRVSIVRRPPSGFASRALIARFRIPFSSCLGSRSSP